MVKIAIFIDGRKPAGLLTFWFTGFPAWHIAFVDTEADRMYDQNLLFRRRIFSDYAASRPYVLLDPPVAISREHLEHWLETNSDAYGVLDYVMFAFSKVLTKLGWKRHNYRGAICSEAINNILVDAGWKSPWGPNDGPPSPADFYTLFGSDRTS